MKHRVQLAKETQTAAANYEKAKSIHAAAKEMVYLAEQGLGEKSTLDTACQEMLSHAASKYHYLSFHSIFHQLSCESACLHVNNAHPPYRRVLMFMFYIYRQSESIATGGYRYS